MTALKFLKYFAYGSNLHLFRMRRRVPSCRALGLATLTGYKLYFHKRGQDGSGKCNAFYTGRSLDRVMGVVYEMAAAERVYLDLAEGLGKGYDLETRWVTLQNAEQEIFFYAAQPNYIDDSLKPFSWYKELVIQGSRMHRLPELYINTIMQLQSIPDPDQTRADEHRRILTEQINFFERHSYVIFD